MKTLIEYLEALKPLSGRETGRLFHGRTLIAYTTPEAFNSEVLRSLAAQELGIREFIQSLEKVGLHVPEIRLRIVPDVQDVRQQPEGPLPLVQPREFALREAQ